MLLFQKSEAPAETLMIFRGSGIFLLFNAIQCHEVKQSFLKTYQRNWKILFGRSACHSTAVLFLIVSVQKLPLSIYAVIEELGPLFALIMSGILLRECIKPLEMFLGAVVFLGVILVIQPPIPILALWQTEESSINKGDYVYVLVAIIAVFLLSSSKVLLRKMSTKNQPVPVSVTACSMAVANFVIGIIVHVYYSGLSWLICVTSKQTVYLVLTVVLATTNQYFGYFANKLEKTPIVALIATMKVPILFVFDIFMYPEVVQDYNILQYIGGVTVFLSILFLIANNYFRMNQKRSKNTRTD